MAGRIPQVFIDELIARTDIVEVITSRVPLKKAGREFMACCPFHAENTPSFSVSPVKQFYYCFGCGAHGTVLGFLMAHDHMGFVEAVEELASRAGLEVPHDEGGGEQRRGTELYEFLARADNFFQRSLKGCQEAIDYLKDRGLDGETAAEFGMGYAPESWDGLVSELGKGSAVLERALAAGVVARNDSGRYYDRFRGRVMFPIRDGRGRTIAFGGRVLGTGEPKYLNSPETSLFHKGRELYGLYEARKALRELPRLLVVEGYMDVVGLAQHGVRCAVATLGTATTTEHLRRLFRVTGEVIFCFDGDRAGRVAAWRALENALPSIRDGRQIGFLFLPEGQDPDSLIRAEGAAAFEERLHASVPLADFLIDHLTAQVNPASVDGRARLAELARPLFGKIPESVYRELVLKRLAEHIGLPAERLRGLLEREEAPARQGQAQRSLKVRHLSTGRGNLVRQAITLLLHYPQLAGPLEVPEGLAGSERPGVPLLAELIEELRVSPHITTAGILERWRDREDGPHLAKLATAEVLVDEEQAAKDLQEGLRRLARDEGPARRTEVLLAKADKEGLSEEEKRELKGLLSVRERGVGPAPKSPKNMEIVCGFS